MSYHTSIPKALYKDQKLKDFDVRLYLVIADHVNEHGYTRITNDTLAEKTGKKKRTIIDTINSLVKHGYLFKKLNAKQNEMYPQDFARVVWLMEPYRNWRWNHKNRTKDEPKTKENDFKLFIAWLREECLQVLFPIEIDGLTNIYSIHQDKLMYKHVGGSNYILNMSDSNDVFKKMFSIKKSIFNIAINSDEGIKDEH